MSLISDCRSATKSLVGQVSLRRDLASARSLQQSFDETPRHFQAVIYFADGPVNLYQLRQWYRPIEALAASRPAAILCRDPQSYLALQRESPFPVLFAPKIADVESFLERQRVGVVFYVNQNTRNFQMMRYAGPSHVFISHGESDKAYMASNQLKAYDYVFVAGEAARQRVESSLIGMAPERLISIGRPQLDAPPSRARPVLPIDGRRSVFYAPTWEGDRPSMSYSSLISHGQQIVTSVLSSPRHRLVYRPHPRTGVVDPRFRAAHQRIVEAIRDANRRDADAGHVVDTGPEFGWQLQYCQVCVSDISAVMFDWLATGKPVVVTESRAEKVESTRDHIFSAVPALSESQAGTVVDRLDEPLGAEAAACYAELVRHYFGDVTPGESTRAFIEASAKIIDSRISSLLATSHLAGVPQQ